MNIISTLEELSTQLQIPDLAFDENNQLTLNLDGKWDVTCELDEMNGEVLFFIPLLKITWEQFITSSTLREINRLSCFGTDTAGAAISYLENMDCAVLWKRYADDFSNTEEIINHITRMANAADHITSNLAQASVSRPDDNHDAFVLQL